MSAYPQTRDYPEALVKILVTVMEKTPHGGASIKDLKHAYESIRGRFPSDKTIYRAIQRLNFIFDPLTGESQDLSHDKNSFQGEGLEALPPVIQTKRKRKRTFYVFTGDLSGNSMDNNIALLITLGIYTQQRGLLKGQFEGVIREILRDTMAKLKEYKDIFKDVERYVYVSGYGPSDPRRSIFRIKEILRAVRNRKRIKMSYLRSYDGQMTHRLVDPYGLICRFNNWYLVGLCRHQMELRIFLLDNMKRMKVLENTSVCLPENFSLKETYGKAWGVWTEEDLGDPEKVLLRVKKGVAEKFKGVCYHDSQEVRDLPGGDVQVSFQVTGAREMVPWLMSWGGTVEVLEPRWLRDLLVQRLEEYLKLYEG
ncbi:MAG: WYL domain-containing protein [Candidatus Syntrophonatronum acetioxidans]|uniref:WYL domain-containing protein n=1 Tax=Candidatus Syntrophonatronum acetioxidans TaxID=1795816 RepID=A0A424YBA0_9FIRM|nr:MAG: WYL domain-containing protein [Candidatus Syntrophonatronum acetioxidans]